MSRPCPVCKKKAKCVDSRHRKDLNYTYRRYTCESKSCDHRFSTIEFEMENPINGAQGNDPYTVIRSIASQVVNLDGLKEAQEQLDKAQASLRGILNRNPRGIL